MNLLTLCDPEYVVQAKAVMNFLGDFAVKPLWTLTSQNILFAPILLVVTLFWAMLGTIAVGWMFHPLFGLFVLSLGIGIILREKEKDELKAQGKWTKQDEANEILDEMNWNQLIMNRQILDTLQVIAQNSKK